jgi:hypothetical protein
VNHRTTLLERLAIGVASLVLSVGLIALLSGFFAGRDQAGVSGGGTPPPSGVVYRDLGHRHLAFGELHPAYDSDPPTSGPHVPLPIEHDATRLNDDQLLEALELGDVVIAYGTPRPPPGLTTLAQQVAGRFTAQLAAAGQAVVLDARPGTQGVIALAWTRMLRAPTASDPQLRAFAEGWLGRGAPHG